MESSLVSRNTHQGHELLNSQTPEVHGKDYLRSLEGVVCAHSDLLLDEAPEAYKDIRVVMRGQADLVKTLFELSPLVSVKGR
jgi:RNA-splicing ligase RtcB